MIQNMERPNTATLIGKGKVEELKELADSMEADMIIFNDELTGHAAEKPGRRDRDKNYRQDHIDTRYICR